MGRVLSGVLSRRLGVGPGVLLPLFLALALPGLGAPQDNSSSAQIFFSKSFPGSVPDYFEVVVEQSGHGTYRESVEDDEPLHFDLTPADTREIFGLAEKLQFFQKPLESKARMARLGVKTLRYQDGKVTGETQFNYSEDPHARALAEWFEKMSETSRHRLNLERSAQFDRMGINKALLLLEVSMDRNRIVAAEQLLPILEKIANGRNYIHMAQTRAAALAERIRSGKVAGR
jgi:hypothetical protein